MLQLSISASVGCPLAVDQVCVPVCQDLFCGVVPLGGDENVLLGLADFHFVQRIPFPLHPLP